MSETLVPINCGVCGVTFALTQALHAIRMADEKSFWCPNGHKLIFRDATPNRAKPEIKKPIKINKMMLQKLIKHTEVIVYDNNGAFKSGIGAYEQCKLKTEPNVQYAEATS